MAIPLDGFLGATYTRFRVDSAGGLTPVGDALDGEVEDDVAYGSTGAISTTAEVTLNEIDPVLANNTDGEISTVVDEPTYIFSDGFETGDTDRWSETSL